MIKLLDRLELELFPVLALDDRQDRFLKFDILFQLETRLKHGVVLRLFGRRLLVVSVGASCAAESGLLLALLIFKHVVAAT